MFKRLDLPQKMNEFLVSITPLLAIGKDEKTTYSVITNYLSISKNKLAIIHTDILGEELSLNILRKKEDPILISAYKNDVSGTEGDRQCSGDKKAGNGGEPKESQVIHRSPTGPEQFHADVWGRV